MPASRNNATRAIASVFGVIAGLSNIQFGFIEILKGNARPENFMFISYFQPALSVIPNYFITGILGIIFSLVFIIWSAAFVRMKNGGLIMIFIAVIQVLFGASLIRAPQEIIYGIIGTRIGKPLKWWRRILPAGSTGRLAAFWPWSFGICAFLYLVHISTIAIESCFGGNNQTLHQILLIIPAFFNIFLFIFMLVSAFARDIERQDEIAL